MTSRTLYVGHAISTVAKGGRIKIPEPFSTVLSKNGGQLRMLIGKSFTQDCLICYDMSVRTMDLDQCRSLIYPRNLKKNEPTSDMDRSVLSTLFVSDVSLGHSFRLPKPLTGSVLEGAKVVFVSLGHAFEIWNIDDLLNSKNIHKNLASLIEGQKVLLH